MNHEKLSATMQVEHASTMIDSRGITHLVWWSGLRNPYGGRRRCDGGWLTGVLEHEALGDRVPTCVRCAVARRLA